MVNISELKLTNLQQRVLRLLFLKAGTSLNAHNIARVLNVSQPAVMKALPYLEKEELITLFQDKESKRWAIELNRENHRIMQLKRADNLKLIYESGLADFLEIEFAGATIILFGSYSYGEDTVNSDIDIAIVGRKEKSIDLEKFENIFGKEIRINFYESFGKIHKNLRSNLFNGIILSGRINL